MDFWTQTGLQRTRELANSGMATPQWRPRFSLARICAGWLMRFFNR